MGHIRVLVANEPRSYRQTFAETLRTLRPDATVYEAQPEELDRNIESLDPDLVICSQLTLAVERASAWVLIYPEGKPVTMVYTAGKLSSFIDLDLDTLLGIVDRTAAQTNCDRDVV